MRRAVRRPSGRRASAATRRSADSAWHRSRCSMRTGRAATRRLLRPRGAVHLTGPVRRGVRGGWRSQRRISARFTSTVKALDRLIPGLRDQWTGAWYEASCADIEVAAFHNSCLGAVRRNGGMVRTDAALISARRNGASWQVETSAGPIEAAVLVNAAGAWGDQVAALAGVQGIGLDAKAANGGSTASRAARAPGPAVRHRPSRKLLFQGRGRQ